LLPESLAKKLKPHGLHSFRRPFLFQLHLSVGNVDERAMYPQLVL